MATPDGGTDIVWNLGSDVADVASGAVVPSGSCAVVGTHATASGIRSTGPVDLVGVRLRPGGLFGLVGVDLHELCGAVLSRRDTGLRLAGGAERTLPGAGGAAALALAVEAAPTWHDDRPLRALLNRRDVTLGASTVAAIAQAAGLSVRQLERRVLRVSGHTAKRLLRLRRLERALELRRRDLLPGWAGVAAAAGFADQAHLSREVLALTGRRPRQLDVASVQAEPPQLGEAGLYPTPGG